MSGCPRISLGTMWNSALWLWTPIEPIASLVKKIPQTFPALALSFHFLTLPLPYHHCILSFILLGGHLAPLGPVNHLFSDKLFHDIVLAGSNSPLNPCHVTFYRCSCLFGITQSADSKRLYFRPARSLGEAFEYCDVS